MEHQTFDENLKLTEFSTHVISRVYLSMRRTNLTAQDILPILNTAKHKWLDDTYGVESGAI
jgi:hypothetical protein